MRSEDLVNRLGEHMETQEREVDSDKWHLFSTLDKALAVRSFMFFLAHVITWCSCHSLASESPVINTVSP
jgi:hypothetical protein